MSETWKKIPDYPLYEVSNYGNVRSWNTSGNKSNVTPPTQLNNHKIKNNYIQYAIGGKNVKMKLAHRLVLEAFVGPCPEGMQGCHNDGNPENNCLENLRWDTISNNMADKKKHGTNNVAIGENQPSAKLKNLEAQEVRRLVKYGVKQRLVAKMFKISPQTVNQIKNGTSYKYV